MVLFWVSVRNVIDGQMNETLDAPQPHFVVKPIAMDTVCWASE